MGYESYLHVCDSGWNTFFISFFPDAMTELLATVKQSIFTHFSLQHACVLLIFKNSIFAIIFFSLDLYGTLDFRFGMLIVCYSLTVWIRCRCAIKCYKTLVEQETCARFAPSPFSFIGFEPVSSTSLSKTYTTALYIYRYRASWILTY